MRISDWSSDVCSSDLFGDDGRSDLRGGGRDQGRLFPPFRVEGGAGGRRGRGLDRPRAPDVRDAAACEARRSARSTADRKSVVEGTSLLVSVNLGGRRIIKKKTPQVES